MNILLTSAGRRTYLVNYFKQALKGTGIVHASNSILTYTLLQADKYVITPNIYDENYIDFLIKYCNKENITVIISLFDIDLPILAKHKQLFKDNNINIIVSDKDVTSICNDKWATYKFLNDIGINQPKTYIAYNDAKTAIEKREISFPVILKPRWGMGSIGIYEVEDLDELFIFYKKLSRDIFKSYLKFESNTNKNACVIIQEKINGQEYGLEILNDLEGNYVNTIAKKKIAMRSGETDIAEIVNNSIFTTTAINISKHLKHIAILDVDCFTTPENQIYVLEMNCRFGGQYPFSHLAGANIPKQIIKWIMGKPTDISLIQAKEGIIGCKDILPVIIEYSRSNQ